MNGKNENSTKNNVLAKPFLKWAGGKSQLLPVFQNYFPETLKQNKIDNYYEPFVGGGAVFFHVAQNYNLKSSYLFDVNPELILTYWVVQKHLDLLIQKLSDIENQYKKLNAQKQREYYYNIRSDFNKNRKETYPETESSNWIGRAGQTIFLNRTCFNGLFRFNSKGEFNVPAGRYKNPKILDTTNLVQVSRLLDCAQIQQADFREIEYLIKPNGFVYYDPPYRPISKSSGFTSYSKCAFNEQDQRDLANIFEKLNKKGVFQMLSNSDPKNQNYEDNFFDELYKNYAVSRVPAKRMINSNAQKRGVINEIIVTNY